MIRHIGAFSARPIFTVATIRQIERILFAKQGGSFILMQRAAQILFKHIAIKWPDSQHFIVVAGAGNNGGDGLLLAVLLKQAGMTVTVLDCAHKPRVDDALMAYQSAEQAGVEISLFLTSCKHQGVIIDAVLGIGARLPLSDHLASVVAWINQGALAGARVMAVDLPTGIDADSGYGIDYVTADMTVSLVARTPGCVLGCGSVACGDLVFESLGSQEVIGQLRQSDGDSPLDMAWFDEQQLAGDTPCPRYAQGHKGRYGHVAVFGGDHGYGGAAIMASEAAAKAGAGTVALVTRQEHVSASLSRNPNVMALAATDKTNLALAVRNNSVLVLGPGLGRDNWGQALFNQVLALDLPLVLDADGLYWLHQTPSISLPGNTVITPHLGEASRLLGWEIERINQDPIGACQALASQYQCVVVLKGVASVVANSCGNVYICGKSQPALSKGGSGDVLSGLVAAALAYYKAPLEAALVAVAWHNYAAGKAAEYLGERRTQPYDVLDYLE